MQMTESAAYSQHFYPVLGVLHAAELTAYGRQVGRSILRHFRGGEDAAATAGEGGGSSSAGSPRWHAVSFDRVDDIPRRKGAQAPGGAADALSPRSAAGGAGGLLLSPQWAAKQQRRPSTVLSLHSLGGSADDDQAAGSDMARNRVCLAAFGLAYTAVVIVSRADTSADLRTAALQQRSGLDAAHFFVCQPGGSIDAFAAFLADIEHRVRAHACAFYAAAFMRTQTKLVAIPQLPLPPRASDPGAVARALAREGSGGASEEFCDAALVSRFSRFLPLRAWLVRYHFKLAVFAECHGAAGLLAQRCTWLAYAHLLAYVGEIAAGAYLPISSSGLDHELVMADRGLSPGWLWPLNGGDADGARAHSLRMFGPRWDEALQLLDALHVRVARAWMTGPTPSSSSPSSGPLDALVFSVHAGECSAATERLMDAERSRRRLQRQAFPTADSLPSSPCDAPVFYVALGSEPADADLMQPPAAAAAADDTACAWWPLGGHYSGVVGLLEKSARYDMRLSLAARHCAQHVAALAQVLAGAGFGAHSSYFWATVGRQHANHAALYAMAMANGVDFARAFDSACTVAADPMLLQQPAIDVGVLRRPFAVAASSKQSDSHYPLSSDIRGGDHQLHKLSSAFAAFAFDPVVASGGGSGGGISAVVAVVGSRDNKQRPLWIWPRTAAALHQAAAYSSLQQHRQLCAEKRTYSATEKSVGETRVFSANPGVENTYASVWLASSDRLKGGDASLVVATRQIFAAMACIHPEETEAVVEANISSAGRQYLCLASQLAEIYVESAERVSEALKIFQALAQRFRDERWTALTRHALQWVVRCAKDDRHAALPATIELMSMSCGQQPQQQPQLLDFDDSAGLRIDVDMTRIYSPVTCHAHWRHWQLAAIDGSRTMAFQVVLDCRSLTQPLRLCELNVEFSDPRYSLRLNDNRGEHAEEEEEAAMSNGGVRFCDVRTAQLCNLELVPGLTLVLEGCVDIGVDADSVLVLVGVSAVVDGSNGGLRLVWPTCAQPSSAATATAVTAIDSGDGEQGGFSHMEALLAARTAISRIHDPLLLTRHGRQSKSYIAAVNYSEHAAVSRATMVSGPSSSVPTNQRWWLPASLTWQSLPSPPLQLSSGEKEEEEEKEPAFSAYSRCRVLGLPSTPASPGIIVTMPSVGERAPAYCGETFAVEIVVCNAHPRLAAFGIVIDVRLVDVDGESSDAHGSETGGGDNTPWVLSLRSDDDNNEGRTRELLGLPLGAGDLQPGESQVLTVFVRFPAAATQLSSASRSTATETAVVRALVRYTTESGAAMQVASHQASIPVSRPLYADIELLPAHISAPESLVMAVPPPPPPSGDFVDSLGEFCFRRPVLVTLHNAGPWDITVNSMSLHPPPSDLLAQELAIRKVAPIRVEVAGSISGVTLTLGAGGSLKHVFWIDIYANDLIRMPLTICPGVLNVEWQRQTDSSIATRMWMPPLHVVSRCLQVESLCSIPVARVGEALTLTFRVINVTRRSRTVDIAMHATDAFVFAGPRRATLTILPGHATVLRFSLLPLTAVGSPPPASSAKDGNNGGGWVLLPRLEIKPAAAAAMAAMPVVPSPSSVSSVIAVPPPPPTRAATSAVFLEQQSSDAVISAQHMVGVLTGGRPLTPGLAEQCLDLLPSCLVDGAVIGGTESDFEDSDDDQVVDTRDTADNDGDLVDILRLDQTAIYCLPPSSSSSSTATTAK